MSQPSCLCQIFDFLVQMYLFCGGNWVSNLNLHAEMRCFSTSNTYLLTITSSEINRFSVPCFFIDAKSWKGSGQEMNNHKAIKNDVTIQLIVVYHRSHVSIRYLTRISLKTFQGFVFSGKVNLLHIVGRSLWN